MSEIQRWSIDDDNADYFEDETGDMVTYEDHLSQLAALREELAAYKLAVTRLGGTVEKVAAVAKFNKDSGEDLQQRLADSERRNESLRVLLRSASTDYACCLESGYDRITQLGGDCDSVEKMLNDNPNYARYIAALNKPEEAKS